MPFPKFVRSLIAGCVWLLAGCGGLPSTELSGRTSTGPYPTQGTAATDSNGTRPGTVTSDAAARDASSPSLAADAAPAQPPFDGGVAPTPDAAVPPRDAALTADADAGPRCEDLPSHDPLTLYLSADDSNSAASPVIARRMLSLGQRVPAGIVRTYEFLNYYHVAYPVASADGVTLTLYGRPGSTADRFQLHVGIASESRTLSAIRPMTLTFVLDTSGSMAGDRIERERAAVRAIAHRLRAGDLVSMVTWNTEQRVLLEGHAVRGPDDATLLEAVAGLSAGGGTDLHGGLVRGYELARAHYGRDRLNRLVVISDGEANVGVTDENMIALEAREQEKEEIYLVGVGVGDGFNDTLMDRVTDKGRGAYVYLDTNAEAERIFGERFAEYMDIAVRDVRLELTLPWYAQVAATSAEEISTSPREVQPQHLAPNDTMVFAQEIQVCAADRIDRTDRVHARATFLTRATRASRSVDVDLSLGELLAADGPSLRRAEAIVAYAEALRAGATTDRAAAQVKFAEARAKLALARAAGDDDELREIDGLLTRCDAIY